MQTSALEQFLAYVEAGGFVMWPLVLATLLLWYALGWRLMNLQRGSRRSLGALVELYAGGEQRKARGIVDRAVATGVALSRRPLPHLRPYLDEAFAHLADDARRFGPLVRSLVAVAPLAGLLGTVTGMIETFDSLADMSLFTQSGGIAGGISQALISTQMGLAVAIPGLIVGRILDRRQRRLEDELDELKDLLCVRAARSAGGES